MNRRNFLINSGLAAAGALIGVGAVEEWKTFQWKVRPPRTYGQDGRYVLHADGVTDDTEALQALFNGKRVYYNGVRVYTDALPHGTIFIRGPIRVPAGTVIARK
jgi:hypothetical protein